MEKNKPQITKAGKSIKTEENWFSKSEIAKMTGLGDRSKKKTKKKLDTTKVKTTVGVTAKKATKSSSKLLKTLLGRLKKVDYKSFNPKKIRVTKELLTSKKTLVIVPILLIGAIGFFLVVTRGNQNGNVSSDFTETGLLGDQFVRQPEYEALTPDGVEVDSGRFDVERKVYQYTYTLDNTEVIVSQQPLPENVISGELNIQQIALSVPNSVAINRFETESVGLVHIVTREDSSQVAIFQHPSEFLVFINSPKQIPNDVWFDFIKSLK